MSVEEGDPLLDKLRTLPTLMLESKRSASALRAAEEALPRKVRPGIRWPQLAVAMALSVAGLIYTVDTVHKLGDIYGSKEVASLSP